jgi:hypothetical protein
VVELTPVNLAVLASLVVALLAGLMAYWGYRSYRATENLRLLFVVLAFVVFVLKSLFIAYNVRSHAVAHDAIEFVGAMFDLIIVLLLFVPFVARTPAR